MWRDQAAPTAVWPRRKRPPALLPAQATAYVVQTDAHARRASAATTARSYAPAGAHRTATAPRTVRASARQDGQAELVRSPPHAPEPVPVGESAFSAQLMLTKKRRTHLLQPRRHGAPPSRQRLPLRPSTRPEPSQLLRRPWQPRSPQQRLQRLPHNASAGAAGLAPTAASLTGVAR